MSKLVKIVYDVAAIRSRYVCVHEEMFQVSARRLVRAFDRDKQGLYQNRKSDLDRLSELILTSQGELESLDEEDLAIRRGRDIRTQLAHYLEALSESVALLKSICEQMKKRAIKDQMYDPQDLKGLRVSYDDAMQHHKRLGASLNSLISAL